MSRSTTMLTVAGIAVGGLVAYAVYFDYKRRTDANFRRQLRKDKKRVAKSQTPSEASASVGGIDANELRSALEKVRKEEGSCRARGKGTILHVAGWYGRAAVYARTYVPPTCRNLVMQLTNMDGRMMSRSLTKMTRRVPSGPPSETSSQEWDKVTDPGTQTPAL
ncbi:hypothetical protein BU15DRAFT_62327 [Melanogaster broomeanus]|nr:hypothetical protein BU15DRAFT_62327 [Melanogaster broomeanus]